MIHIINSSLKMPECVCPDCGYVAINASRLQRHLKKQNKCNIGKHVCDCGNRFNDKSNFNKHKKICKGRPKTKSDREKELAEHDIIMTTTKYEKDKLQQRVNDLEEEIAKITVEYQESEEDIANDTDDIAPAHSVQTWAALQLDLETVFDTDVKKSQVYFFECGPKLKPVSSEVVGVLIKFGSTDQPYKRLSTHFHDFGGGRLLDSVLTNNPKSVEADLKKWMKITGRITPSQSETKKSEETEVFVIKSQHEYQRIVEKAKALADDYQKDIETASVYKKQLQEAKDELEAFQKAESA